MTATVRDLGVCRWELECATAATTTVRHSTLGDYPACDDHAAEHQRWVDEDRGHLRLDDDGKPVGARLTPRAEPDPECYCPTSPRKRVPYCPEHGTKAQRGIDPLADDD